VESRLLDEERGRDERRARLVDLGRRGLRGMEIGRRLMERDELLKVLDVRLSL
jgi:hypothetical protein